MSMWKKVQKLTLLKKTSTGKALLYGMSTSNWVHKIHKWKYLAYKDIITMVQISANGLYIKFI